MNRSPTHFASWQPLGAGHRAEAGGVEIVPFSVPHDAADPLGFVLEAHGLRCGLATDVGHVTPEIVERLRGCHILMIESNHDDRMLAAGPYPWPLKQRVAGRLGHLSNREAALLLRETVGDDCRAVVLAHLSERNNTHELARGSALAAVGTPGGRRPTIRVAVPGWPTPAVCL
jgi:phosphoribosyl 1,2-cyclic phosphodiesterase